MFDSGKSGGDDESIEKPAGPQTEKTTRPLDLKSLVGKSPAAKSAFMSAGSLSDDSSDEDSIVEVAPKPQGQGQRKSLATTPGADTAGSPSIVVNNAAGG